jgi:hypothetical protein
MKDTRKTVDHSEENLKIQQRLKRYRQREKSLKSPSEKIINNKTINNEEGD